MSQLYYGDTPLSQMPATYPASRVTHESVSVTADGVKTYSALLDELYALIDFQKITNRCVFEDVTSSRTQVYQISVITPNTSLQFYRTSSRSNVNVQTSVFVKQTGSTYGYYNGATYTDESGLVLASGRVLAIHY